MKPKIIGLVILTTVFLITIDAFAAQFTFSPRIRADANYTDNVNLTENDKEDDFIILLSAGFTAQLLGRTSGAELSSDYGYAFYDQNSDNDTYRIPINFRAWTSPTQHTTFEFTNNFLRSEDPVAQDQIVVQNGRVEESGDTTVRRGREPYYRNRAGLRASHQFGDRDRIYADFIYGLLRNDDEQVEDNDNYTGSAGLDYEFTHRIGTQLFAAFTRGEFDQQSGFIGEPTSDFDNWVGSARFLGRISRHFSLFFQYDQAYRNFDSSDSNDYLVYAPSAGFTYDITQDTSSRLGLGYYYQQIENEQDQENPFLNAAISTNWNYQRGWIGLTGLAGLTQNDFGAQNVGFQQFAAIQSSANYNFTRRITGDVSANYRISLVPGRSDEQSMTGNDDRTDHRAQFDVGLGFRPTRWMTLRLGYTFNYYNTNADNEPDYQENRAQFTITLAPDQPWRW